MPRGKDSPYIENAIQAYLSGKGYVEAATEVQMSPKKLKKTLSERGILRDRRASWALGAAALRMPLPDAEIITRYQSGESVCALATHFGISRCAIKARLIAAGIELRSGTEANRLMASKRTPEEHRAFAAAAHIAATGRKHTPEERRRMALTREANRTHISPSEQLLQVWLAERGIESIPQKAVGPYNTDLGAAPVAVEIFGGNWHPYRDTAERVIERTHYFFDQGWNLVVIWVDKRTHPLTVATADYVVAFLEQSRRDPAFRRQYRVIWGDGDEVPSSGSEFDDLTRIPPRGRRDRARA